MDKQTSRKFKYFGDSNRLVTEATRPTLLAVQCWLGRWAFVVTLQWSTSSMFAQETRTSQTLDSTWFGIQEVMTASGCPLTLSCHRVLLLLLLLFLFHVLLRVRLPSSLCCRSPPSTASLHEHNRIHSFTLWLKWQIGGPGTVWGSGALSLDWGRCYEISVPWS